MKYFSVADARQMRGLRLVLTAHLPGPWSESAKAIFNARNVAYIAVEQVAGGANEELCTWTGGIRNAPVAMLDDDPPTHGWLDLAMMAERLGSGPSLLPEQSADRALALGLSAEICAPHGFGWARRLLMFETSYGPKDMSDESPAHVRTMLLQYGFSDAAVTAARARLIDIMGTLAGQLRAQRERGSRYMIGNRPSTIDFHWACFSQMVAPLPVEHQPAMPEWLIEKYSDLDPEVAKSLDPVLIEHRDFIYRNHIGLPLEF